MTTSTVPALDLQMRTADGPPVDAQAEPYRQILRSSALIGTSSLLNIVVGIGRTKALAVLLGPASFGLMGAYLSIVDLGRTLAQLGVNSSGVRQIAESAATGDECRTSLTSLTLRRVALVTAAIGAALTVLLAPYISELTFGTRQHEGDVALLALAIFFGVVAGGQSALLQGLRRIADLAKLAFYGSFIGAVASVAFVYAFPERGLAAAVVLGALAMAVTGWWFARRVELPPVHATSRETVRHASALLKLGVAFMSSGLLTLGAAYVVRIVVLRNAGLEAAGLYQAAWTLGGLYVGFVLQSMAADFYPRLVGEISRKDEANRLVNQQAKVSLLLAGPGVLATLTFATAVLHVLYSSKFDGAADILRWICLGMALRVITWPIGFIVVATGRQVLFVFTEAAWAVVNVALTWYCVDRLGPVGAGVAFFGSYLFHAALLYPIVRRLTGFRWSRENLALGLSFVAAAGLVFVALQMLPGIAGICIGLIATVVSSIYSLRSLADLAAREVIPGFIAKLMRLRTSATSTQT